MEPNVRGKDGRDESVSGLDRESRPAAGGVGEAVEVTGTEAPEVRRARFEQLKRSLETRAEVEVESEINV
jgi:hypothetical protein